MGSEERQSEEPTRRELRAIEAEWPVIRADLAVVAAECAAAADGVELDELAVRRAVRSLRERAHRLAWAIPDGAA